jgi:hypothetical protein
MRTELQKNSLIAGLDPAIHAASLLDARVTPGSQPGGGHEVEENV